MEWPVREGLIAYIELLQRDAVESYRHECALYAAGGLKAAPTIPKILETTNG